MPSLDDLPPIKGVGCVHDFCKVCRKDKTDVEASCLRYWCPKQARYRRERYIDEIAAARVKLREKFGADQFPDVPREHLCKTGFQPRFDTGIPADMERYPHGCPDPDFCHGDNGCHWNCKRDPDPEDF